MRCSIIIPILNEEKGISCFLAHLQKFRTAGHEVIVVDGGSTDSTCQLATPHVDQLLKTSSGRARQMNAGAAVASGEVLVFLHADTYLPDSAMQDLMQGLMDTKKSWGRFSVKLSGDRFLFRLIEFMMNLRSCVTGIVTGDHVMFIRRDVFSEINGFDDIPLMEDIAMSKKLKSYSRPICLSNRVSTSSRRWEQHGIVKTIFLMWSLRLCYFFGVSPEVLVQQYYKKKNIKSACLCIFTKAPIPGKVKTRLLSCMNEDDACELHKELVRNTVSRLAIESPWQLQLWGTDVKDPFLMAMSEKYGIGLHEQVGSDLGQRMAHTAETILLKNSYVILIGTDCPELSAIYLGDVLHKLMSGADCVLGPAEDGGYVMLALSRYDKSLFSDIEWGTGSVLDVTRERIKSLDWRCEEMPVLWDVDRPEDYERLKELKKTD